jgi:NTP pyrophosphatase (non-canonical NTP hydrolase)
VFGFIKIKYMELNNLAVSIYEANKKKGFWDEKRNVGEMLMLVTTELAEALEAHRKFRFANLSDADKNDSIEDESFFTSFVKDTFEDEIADAVIRLFDMAGGLNIDLDYHISAKLHYNSNRPYKHGKNY